MVDEDKQACRLLADSGFQGGQWPESYITWEFLEKHPKAMEPGYLSLNWNHIPGLFHQKEYMRTMVIARADLQCDSAIPPGSKNSGNLLRTPHPFILH